jgi:hypothetical protein
MVVLELSNVIDVVLGNANIGVLELSNVIGVVLGNANIRIN